MRFILQTKCAVDAPDSSGKMALHHAGEVQNFLVLRIILFTLICLDYLREEPFKDKQSSVCLAFFHCFWFIDSLF